MTTDELRASFLVPDLFQPGQVTLRAVDLDRVVLGGAVPLRESLRLEAPAAMAAEFFAQRRELGVLNIGASGHVRVDGVSHPMRNRDGLYVGRGARELIFESDSPEQPARFYLVSYPAHVSCPTRHITRERANVTELGTVKQANRRRLYKYIYPGGVESAQLVMGITELEEGSVWNTMPPHTHVRRTEVYLYFDLPDDALVFHFVGEPAETRNVIVRDGQVALSPAWSIHAGCGTTSYTFCWAMGGENQEFADMQMVAMRDLR
ncbi:MAG TPA: 5-dehydro-4-deoxy-D-glucuronate isomerase [Gemmatimonadaceae bacterium]|nr:5-dehydro-4-deoxy-D-glucuronate isomerase [Gemmatimonadaceae bacterium]